MKSSKDDQSNPRKFVRITRVVIKGKVRYRLSWKEEDGTPMMKTITNEAEAEDHANKVEEMLSRNLHHVAALGINELIEVDNALRRLPRGVTLSVAVDAYLSINADELKRLETPMSTVLTEFLDGRKNKSPEHYRVIKSRLEKFLRHFPAGIPVERVEKKQINEFLETQISSHPRTKENYRTSICTFFHYARENGYLPYGKKTEADKSNKPNLDGLDDNITAYTPHELMHILAYTPTVCLSWLVLGAFAGVRERERRRLTWWAYQPDYNTLQLRKKQTKNKRVRGVILTPNIHQWLNLVRGNDTEPLVPIKFPIRRLTGSYKRKGIRTPGTMDAAAQTWNPYPNSKDKPELKWEPNALRHSYASYHVMLSESLELTSMNDGHSVDVLQNNYQFLANKAEATTWFNITPMSVIQYCKENGLPTPEWAPTEMNLAVVNEAA